MHVNYLAAEPCRQAGGRWQAKGKRQARTPKKHARPLQADTSLFTVLQLHALKRGNPKPRKCEINTNLPLATSLNFGLDTQASLACPRCYTSLLLHHQTPPNHHQTTKLGTHTGNRHQHHRARADETSYHKPASPDLQPRPLNSYLLSFASFPPISPGHPADPQHCQAQFRPSWNLPQFATSHS